MKAEMAACYLLLPGCPLEPWIGWVTIVTAVTVSRSLLRPLGRKLCDVGVLLEIVAVSLFAICGSGILLAQGPGAHAIRQPVSFCEDQQFQNSVALPPDVSKMLLETDELAMQAAESDEDLAQRTPSKLFRATTVRLSSTEADDLLLIGICPMCGADNGWFWVVRSAHKSPRVILSADGNCVDLMGTRTNGHRDIRTVWSSPSETLQTIYHFDGKEYRVWKEKRGKNRP